MDRRRTEEEDQQRTEDDEDAEGSARGRRRDVLRGRGPEAAAEVASLRTNLPKRIGTWTRQRAGVGADSRPRVPHRRTKRAQSPVAGDTPQPHGRRLPHDDGDDEQQPQPDGRPPSRRELGCSVARTNRSDRWRAADLEPPRPGPAAPVAAAMRRIPIGSQSTHRLPGPGLPLVGRRHTAAVAGQPTARRPSEGSHAAAAVHAALVLDTAQEDTRTAAAAVEAAGQSAEQQEGACPRTARPSSPALTLALASASPCPRRMWTKLVEAWMMMMGACFNL